MGNHVIIIYVSYILICHVGVMCFVFCGFDSQTLSNVGRVFQRPDNLIFFDFVFPTGGSKNVSWLLGRDGDVAVIVIGEVDELSAKFICSGLEKKQPNLQNSTK